MAKIAEDGQGIVYSTFDVLYSVDCSEYLEKKQAGNVELTYLSWSDAWAEVKKRYPKSNYWVRFFNDKPFIYDEKLGYMVFVNVQIEDTMHEMWLPVQDGANQAMKDTPYEYKVKNKSFPYANLDAKTGKYLDKNGHVQEEYITKSVKAADMSDINKALMRCLVKGIAMHGLGLYIYSGEDVIEYSYEEHNKVATEFMETRQKLSQYVDIRSEEFEKYVCEKAGANNIKPEVLVNIPGQMRRVTEVMKSILKNKEEKAKEEKKKAKANETKADA